MCFGGNLRSQRLGRNKRRRGGNEKQLCVKVSGCLTSSTLLRDNLQPLISCFQSNTTPFDLTEKSRMNSPSGWKSKLVWCWSNWWTSTAYLCQILKLTHCIQVRNATNCHQWRHSWHCSLTCHFQPDLAGKRSYFTRWWFVRCESHENHQWGLSKSYINLQMRCSRCSAVNTNWPPIHQSMK